MAKRHYPAHHDHVDEEKLTVSEPEDHAAGVKAVAVSMGRACITWGRPAPRGRW